MILRNTSSLPHTGVHSMNNSVKTIYLYSEVIVHVLQNGM